MISDKAQTRALLLDIEGTVTPISFVHDILFPFARTNLRSFLDQHSAKADVQQDIAALFHEYSIDQDRGAQPPAIDVASDTSCAVVTYVNWLIDLDRKSPGLKSLQGKIWEKGYRDGTLKAPLFEDVVPNLLRLRGEGIEINIFSSGSVLAQKLLFAHTLTGDHTDLIEHYFDTGVGSKVNSASYVKIAELLGDLPEEIIFVSDVTKELRAAREAGLAALLCVRPGNQPQSDTESFQAIDSFSEIQPIGDKTRHSTSRHGN
jgi:enolase-phosphatase E1